jgi:hypothetical protein
MSPRLICVHFLVCHFVRRQNGRLNKMAGKMHGCVIGASAAMIPSNNRR